MDIDQVRAELPGAAPALLRYARLLTGDEHDAADLVQDTLLRGLEAADRFDGRSSLTTWLRRVMHNLWVDTSRGAREDPSDQVAELVEAQWRADDYTVDAAVVAERAATRDDLREALTHLPTIYRTTVVLHDAEGLTVAEIADIAGIGLPAAKQRLRRGRMMLVTALAQGRPVPQEGVPMRCWEARSQVSDYMPRWSPPATPWPATHPPRTPTPSSPTTSLNGSRPCCAATEPSPRPESSRAGRGPRGHRGRPGTVAARGRGRRSAPSRELGRYCCWSSRRWRLSRMRVRPNSKSARGSTRPCWM